VSTTAKRTLTKSRTPPTRRRADPGRRQEEQLTVTGPRTTITTNWGDENYDFDIALPVDRNDGAMTDPVKAGRATAARRW
jgi:hypothetical protein